MGKEGRRNKTTLRLILFCYLPTDCGRKLCQSYWLNKNQYKIMLNWKLRMYCILQKFVQNLILFPGSRGWVPWRKGMKVQKPSDLPAITGHLKSPSCSEISNLEKLHRYYWQPCSNRDQATFLRERGEKFASRQLQVPLTLLVNEEQCHCCRLFWKRTFQFHWHPSFTYYTEIDTF